MGTVRTERRGGADLSGSLRGVLEGLRRAVRAVVLAARRAGAGACFVPVLRSAVQWLRLLGVPRASRILDAAGGELSQPGFFCRPSS